MSKLSEKPVSIPRPLRTRDLILQILDRQALPISTLELCHQLRKLGPSPYPKDVAANLADLSRLGHIRREPEYGVEGINYWVRVPDNIVPKHRPLDQTTRLRAWTLDTLKHGPATAAMLVAGAKQAGLIESSAHTSQASRFIGTYLHLLCMRGELKASPIRTVTGTVYQYRLPGPDYS